MDRIDKFASEIENVEDFISKPLDFLYEHIDNPTSSEIIECYRFICLNNRRALEVQREYLKHLEKYIADVKPLSLGKNDVSLKTEDVPRDVVSNKKNSKDISEMIDYVTYCNIDTELDAFLETLSYEDIMALKLYFLKEIRLHEDIIKEAIMEDANAQVGALQSELSVYRDILNHLKQYNKRSEQKTCEDNSNDISNIILLPSNRSSYIFEDIVKYPEKSKEIKNAFDKIIEGYFLQTKDLKAIVGVKDSLFEYRNPNGLRVLYIVKNNFIFIVSLFFKDKQKSIKISGFYEEALKRFNNSVNYVVDNINNPDFYIEQAELVGQVYSFLENNMVAYKRLGDHDE